MKPIHRRFDELPITCTEPAGWLRAYLETQRHGLTGHLEVAGPPFHSKGWACRKIIPRAGDPLWGTYEAYGYWVDGMLRCGYLLGDDFLIAKARSNIDYVLRHADRDGYLGPQTLKKPGSRQRWPHTVFFRALMAHYSATADTRIVKALKKHYLSNTSDHFRYRDVCNLEIMLWVYDKTGDRRMLKQAVKAYTDYCRIEIDIDVSSARILDRGADTTLEGMLSNKRGRTHGSTYNEICKLPALLYMYTGRRRYLQASVNAFRKIDRYHMLIDGVCSSTEVLRGKDPLDSHETCDIADYTWSVGYLLQITGQAHYADKIERACFNAAPGAVTSDFRALQYFSCPNQVVADRTSNHNLYSRGDTRMSYRPQPHTCCCPAEVNRIMPNFAARMWLTDGRDGIVAALYGPSRIRARLGKSRQQVTIVQETHYPFAERIDLGIRTAKPVEFTLTLRIPGWCRKAQILINEKGHKAKLKPGTFIKIRRTFRHNDRIILILPMELKLSRWPKGGVGIERGPLVYALGIREKWEIDKDDPNQSKEFPAWNLYPASDWNYALALDPQNLDDQIEVVHHPAQLNPWSVDTAPIELRVPARRVRQWKIIKKKTIDSYVGRGVTERVRGNFAFTPPLPDPRSLARRLAKKIETISLVPYGCTKLRITIFPAGK